MKLHLYPLGSFEEFIVVVLLEAFCRIFVFIFALSSNLSFFIDLFIFFVCVCSFKQIPLNFSRIIGDEHKTEYYQQLKMNEVPFSQNNIFKKILKIIS